VCKLVSLAASFYSVPQSSGRSQGSPPGEEETKPDRDLSSKGGEELRSELAIPEGHGELTYQGELRTVLHFGSSLVDVGAQTDVSAQGGLSDPAVRLRGKLRRSGSGIYRAVGEPLCTSEMNPAVVIQAHVSDVGLKFKLSADGYMFGAMTN